jgi:hypothetical protein
MSIQEMKFTIKGITPLLQNNPQCVDRFNYYARSISKINMKGKRRTDEDYLELRDLEISAKIYWNDNIGIFVPTRWVAAALAKVSFTQAKISKASFRGGVFMDGDKMELSYRGKKSVKSALDIVKNHDFRHLMLLPQGQVRVAKVSPIFHDWAFSGGLEFDDKIIDSDTLKSLLKYSAHYGGFGDFRPTFGRGEAEVKNV